ncbi:MAG TPA: 16S rRNA (guanine(527)-N(7))-methyltransferase RsmG [Steroidobacteraceae bacterium]|jgi:16S rRNA (guanine527-N7)-methyltransferase|nr:16S rRNA (guanine(527)-N(7))-methyltransferase RsmG [Steroidobacteraceae bacterium]
MSEPQALIADAAALSVALSEAQAAQLLQLLDELAQWSRAYNLTAIREREAMKSAHLLDSLAALADVAGSRILDVGTGAGFPGLPLAIAAPERQFTLVDAVAKKIRFVNHACRRLGLANVQAVHARVQSLAPTAPFDTILARAYAGLPALLADVQGLAGPGTRVVALKGMYPHEELARLPSGWRLEQIRSPQIPWLNASRHILHLVPVADAHAAAAQAPVVPSRQRLD